MEKVVITIQDVEDEDHNIHMETDFDPVFHKETASPAQILALKMLMTAEDITGAQAEIE